MCGGKIAFKMNDHETEKERLLKELAELRQRISELEKSEAEHQQIG